MDHTRRHFLRSALALGAYGTTYMGYLGRQALAQGVGGGNKKLLLIFQRGGNDGLNTLIPHGDNEYNTTNRPTLFIPDTDSIDLGNGFASLHPMMAPMMPLFNDGQLALIHRVGYVNQSRSHFDSQDFWEKGVPNNPDITDGMLYRQLREMLDLNNPANSFAAATINGSAFTALKGAVPLPNFTASSQFNFLGNTNEQAKFLGRLPTSKGAGNGKGMLGLYGDSPLADAFYASSVNATGVSLAGTISTLAAAQGPYTPENGAAYPAGGFGNLLRECAMLFKRTDVRILGTEIGGFDTHTNQGAVNGSHGDLLQEIAEGIQALSLDLQAQWNDVVIVTMTEFGRTSAENGSFGTDHAEASVVFAAGGGINGGVYNCDATKWADGDMFSKSGRYLARNTDFRAIYGEIFRKHFGTAANRLEVVMPGYNQDALDFPDDFAELGIMS